MIRIQDYEKVGDKEVISRVLSGETALYEILMRRYNPYLFKVGRSYGYNQPDTEDLMQDSFLNAYTNLPKFEQRSSVKTWLVRIMLNNCYHKSKKFSFKYEFTTDSLEKLKKPFLFTRQPSSTGSAVMNNELKNIIEKAVLRLPEDYRMVFTMRELNEMSTRETSEALGISEANVKVRLNRAKKMLRKEIEKTYSPEEIFEFNLIYCDRIVQNVLRSIREEQELREKIKPGKEKSPQGIASWRASFLSGLNRIFSPGRPK